MLACRAFHQRHHITLAVVSLVSHNTFRHTPPPSAPFFHQTVRQCGALTERKGSGRPANENTPTDCPTSHVRSEAGKALTVQRQSRLGKAGAMTGIVSHHGAPSPVRPHLNTQDALASHWDSGLSRLSTLQHTGRFVIPLGFRRVSSVHTSTHRTLWHPTGIPACLVASSTWLSRA